MRESQRTGSIVLAAGRSVRFRSARSKLVHPLGGRPLIQWVLATLRAAAVNPIVVVVGHDSENVRDACGPDVEFAYQPDPRGTGHAVLMAAPLLGEFEGDILILNGDLPFLRPETLSRIVSTHRDSGADLTLATASVAEPRGWGRIVRRNGSVSHIVEEKDATPEQRAVEEVNVGLYCVRPSVLFPLLERVTPNNAQGEIYLTDLVAKVAEAGGRIADVRIDIGEVGQINSRGELARMEKTLRTRINTGWMEAGVTLDDPDTTYIGPEVLIGRDTSIGPNVHLRGHTVIGEGCRIDGSAFLTDARIGNNVLLRFAVVMTGVEVAQDCEVGPFANLRPGTRLGPGVHIGDFVETKNAALGAGTKANHLAYLGDTEIGRDTNIGAGTITCNYDGFRKRRTVIGDRVQVGSDTQLVAPVTLGDDVYVASGTTVRRDVPAGALVFNEKGEIHRKGWVNRYRARVAAEATAERPRARKKADAKKIAAKKRVAARPGKSSAQTAPRAGAVKPKTAPRRRG